MVTRLQLTDDQKKALIELYERTLYIRLIRHAAELQPAPD